MAFDVTERLGVNANLSFIAAPRRQESGLTLEEGSSWMIASPGLQPHLLPWEHNASSSPERQPSVAIFVAYRLSVNPEV